MSLADEIAEAAAESPELFPESGRILTFTQESTGGGGYRETFVPGEGIVARIAPVGGGEGSDEAERVDDRSTHVVTCPAGTEISDRDRIELDGVGTFAVTLVRRRSLEIVRRVEVEEVAP